MKIRILITVDPDAPASDETSPIDSVGVEVVEWPMRVDDPRPDAEISAATGWRVAREEPRPGQSPAPGRLLRRAEELEEWATYRFGERNYAVIVVEPTRGMFETGF